MPVDRKNGKNLIKPYKDNNKEYIQPRRELLDNNSSFNLRFSFVNFKFDFINIDNVFNNYFKDEESATVTMYNFLKSGLPLLETITVKDFLSGTIRKNLHCHKINDSKLDIVKEIMKALKFSETFIEGLIIDGGIYQIEIPYEKGPIRMVGEIIGNNFYLLFLDTNHHIYFNKKKVEEAGSLYYESCPIADSCVYLDGGSCLLDELMLDSFNDTYNYNCNLKED